MHSSENDVKKEVESTPSKIVKHDLNKKPANIQQAIIDKPAVNDKEIQHSQEEGEENETEDTKIGPEKENENGTEETDGSGNSVKRRVRRPYCLLNRKYQCHCGRNYASLHALRTHFKRKHGLKDLNLIISYNRDFHNRPFGTKTPYQLNMSNRYQPVIAPFAAKKNDDGSYDSDIQSLVNRPDNNPMPFYKVTGEENRRSLRNSENHPYPPHHNVSESNRSNQYRNPEPHLHPPSALRHPSPKIQISEPKYYPKNSQSYSDMERRSTQSYPPPSSSHSFPRSKSPTSHLKSRRSISDSPSSSSVHKQSYLQHAHQHSHHRSQPSSQPHSHHPQVDVHSHADHLPRSVLNHSQPSSRLQPPSHSQVDLYSRAEHPLHSQQRAEHSPHSQPQSRSQRPSLSRPRSHMYPMTSSHPHSPPSPYPYSPPAQPSSDIRKPYHPVDSSERFKRHYQDDHARKSNELSDRGYRSQAYELKQEHSTVDQYERPYPVDQFVQRSPYRSDAVKYRNPPPPSYHPQQQHPGKVPRPSKPEYFDPHYHDSQVGYQKQDKYYEPPRVYSHKYPKVNHIQLPHDPHRFVPTTNLSREPSDVSPAAIDLEKQNYITENNAIRSGIHSIEDKRSSTPTQQHLDKVYYYSRKQEDFNHIYAHQVDSLPTKKRYEYLHTEDREYNYHLSANALTNQSE
eukprot:Awhi_evm1s6376